PFPGWEAIQEEQLETPPGAWIAIQDAQGNVVQNVSVRPKKGTQRVTWNLRHSSTRPIRMGQSGGRGYGFGGPLAMPGTYTASLFVEENGAVNQVGEAVSFEVKPLREGVLKGISYEEFDAYRTQHTALMQESYALEDALIKSNTLLKAYKQSAERTTALPGALMGEIAAAEKALQALNEAVEGNAAREEVGERNPPNVSTHLSVASRGLSTTYGPTALHKKSLKLAQKMMQELAPQIQKMYGETLPTLEAKLKAAGAPYIMGSK
ncbi:MAG: glycosyl hydrolase, partial [Flavobacteriaceae bacterium]